MTDPSTTVAPTPISAVTPETADTGASDTGTADTGTADTGTADSVPVNTDAELDDDSLAVLGKYPVEGDAIDGNPDPMTEQVWVRFAHLFPAALRPEITLFVAIDADRSDDTDGALEPNGLRPAEDYIALDVTGSDAPDELDRTMIHEFAHLLTLRASQLPPDDTAIDSCPVYTDSVGCPAKTSYLYAFDTQFWPGQTDDDIDQSDDAIEQRYETGDFVTDYAATNPDEDIAEVFAEWVLESAPPAGSTVIDRKLRFFDAYPEVGAIRTMVRSALGR
ncbi:MAG: hypothetical protein JWM34_531 [Ilumatobacteraceae bacterium]|nr:hypothetical protein [Ilumatobacteraceae bacterium]